MKVQNEKNRFGSWFYLKQSWGKIKIVATHIFQANEALQIHTTKLKKKQLSALVSSENKNKLYFKEQVSIKSFNVCKVCAQNTYSAFLKRAVVYLTETKFTQYKILQFVPFCHMRGFLILHMIENTCTRVHVISKPHSGRQTMFESVLLLPSVAKAKQTIWEQSLAGQKTVFMREIQTIV